MPEPEELFVGFMALLLSPLWIPAFLGLVLYKLAGKILSKLE